MYHIILCQLHKPNTGKTAWFMAMSRRCSSQSMVGFSKDQAREWSWDPTSIASHLSFYNWIEHQPKLIILDGLFTAELERECQQRRSARRSPSPRGRWQPAGTPLRDAPRLQPLLLHLRHHHRQVDSIDSEACLLIETIQWSLRGALLVLCLRWSDHVQLWCLYTQMWNAVEETRSVLQSDRRHSVSSGEVPEPWGWFWIIHLTDGSLVKRTCFCQEWFLERTASTVLPVWWGSCKRVWHWGPVSIDHPTWHLDLTDGRVGFSNRWCKKSLLVEKEGRCLKMRFYETDTWTTKKF